MKTNVRQLNSHLILLSIFKLLSTPKRGFQRDAVGLGGVKLVKNWNQIFVKFWIQKGNKILAYFIYIWRLNYSVHFKKLL